ncbi:MULTISPECIES: DNA gyrase/topoisomerase IV subunit A [Winkia]|uniref:DNA topoisomerase (ATP-hydrolyzing) n=1 Tax=Winkia neuii subsp. anitrata TaxID=29318 RepID=A0AB38XS04_9ACTO|nr:MULTISPECIES: DNA topoisomerase IV subunit A [Winkia]MDK7162676.1 DNA topoisomerase IV subunit A [Winkia sp. UMB3105]MDK8594089.1 DNA topoisomerase IV subunit A [Winkia sp. UMB1096A]WCE47074.1 DNA topoisomerase IV subunit A [Winkia neuii subsp. anitrata]
MKSLEHEDTDTIVDIDVSQEMQTSFLEYAYSVIYTRALPDARDGLKPVQRRILYTMSNMGLLPTKGHVKSSRVVGEVMGKLHPHGDSAIYDAIVRLAQDFTMRLPLADGHGNFGSLDDGPAASRYTEVRMAEASSDMVSNIAEDTVDMEPNYDSTLTQPSVLPAGFPNLLVNGASGIAVGMATNIAPHNLGEVTAGARYLLANPDATTEDLMRFIPGPDLPCGGIIVGLDGIRDAYETGRGVFKTRAKTSIERVSPRKHGIVVTELPYLVGPERVIEKIKEGVKRGRIKGLSNVSDLTDRNHGLRIVIEVKNGFNPEAVLSQLFRHTPMEDSFGINAVALVDGQPQTLGLKKMLQVFLDHRMEVVLRRSKYRLNKAQERLHLVEGLLIAVLDIDDVIAIIRASEDVASARERLKTAFDLDDVQADHILALRLRKLTKFSRLELEGERDELMRDIATLQEIIENDQVRKDLVSKELAEVSDRLSTPRRTLLLEDAGAVVPTASAKANLDLEVADDPCQLLLSTTGRLARVSGEESVSRTGSRSPHDALAATLGTTVRAEVGLATSKGRMLRFNVLDTPSLPRTQDAPSLNAGMPAESLVDLQKDERVIGLASLDPNSTIMGAISRSGQVKRIRPEYPVSKDEWIYMGLEDSDEVLCLVPAPDEADAVLISSTGQLLRTPGQKIRPQGTSGHGVAGMSVQDGAVIAGTFTAEQDALVITVAALSTALPGTGQTSAKVTPLSEFPTKGRGGQGVRAQRFLKDEDCLEVAGVLADPRAVDSAGSPVELPDINPKRDGSGSPLLNQIASIG